MEHSEEEDQRKLTKEKEEISGTSSEPIKKAETGDDVFPSAEEIFSDYNLNISLFLEFSSGNQNLYSCKSCVFRDIGKDSVVSHILDKHLDIR